MLASARRTSARSRQTQKPREDRKDKAASEEKVESSVETKPKEERIMGFVDEEPVGANKKKVDKKFRFLDEEPKP